MNVKMTVLKRFAYGFLILLAACVIGMGVTLIRQEVLEVETFLIPFIVFFALNLVILFMEAVFNPTLVKINKVLSLIMITIVFLTRGYTDKFEFFLYFSILIPFVLCQIPLEKEEERIRREFFGTTPPKEIIKSYVILFLILILVYSIAAMFYWDLTPAKNETGKMILICAIILPVIFWGMYLLYRFVIKRTKITTVVKKIIILFCGIMIYFLCSSKEKFIEHLPIIIDLASYITLTIHDLYLEKQKQKQYKPIFHP
jgi:hypothetical protein